jgi:hypothetical protein
MAVRSARERLIHRVWAERGSAIWKPPGPLIIDLPSDMKAAAPPRRAVRIPASLTYELRPTTVKGKAINEIVCEGVVVEPLAPSPRL